MTKRDEKMVAREALRQDARRIEIPRPARAKLTFIRRKHRLPAKEVRS